MSALGGGDTAGAASAGSTRTKEELETAVTTKLVAVRKVKFAGFWCLHRNFAGFCCLHRNMPNPVGRRGAAQLS